MWVHTVDSHVSQSPVLEAEVFVFLYFRSRESLLPHNQSMCGSTGHMLPACRIYEWQLRLFILLNFFLSTLLPERKYSTSSTE